ncbi:hypothetical protein WJX75_005221 [Coccomyxa subellipsoidea]|uniref:J domain-containing protein n=1 Tax=Coccomyxa subellipsoidea TaxID=248742 RepID=A0ABR2Z4M1_9CHLO
MDRKQFSQLLLLLLTTFSALAAKDFYDILQVPKGASDSLIKRSYRKLALQYHPDKVKGTEEEKTAAAKRFAEISHAYEVLSDDEKRRIYDRYGEEGLKQHDQGGGGGGGAADIFSQFFGGGFPGFGGFGGMGDEEEQTPKGDDVRVDLEVTLKDLYLGHQFKVMRDKPVAKPAPGKRKCNCRNKVVTRQLGPGMFQQFQQQECQECQNIKFERETETITISVESGMRNGQEIVFFEEGEPLLDGEPGDLKFIVRTLPHKRFQRDGNDLKYNLTISLVDALTGFTTEFEHLDGHKVKVEAAGVTIPGQVFKVEGEGMPLFDHPNKAGDLYATITVAFPAKLSEAQKDAVRKVFKGMHDEL